MDFNKTILTGRLVAAPDLRTFGDETIASITLASNLPKKKDGTEQPAMFISCVAYGRNAEILGEYTAKGSRLLIEGRLKLDKWQDKQSGENKSKHVVVIASILLLDTKDASSKRDNIIPPKNDDDDRYDDIFPATGDHKHSGF